MSWLHPVLKCGDEAEALVIAVADAVRLALAVVGADAEPRVLPDAIAKARRERPGHVDATGTGDLCLRRREFPVPVLLAQSADGDVGAPDDLTANGDAIAVDDV